MTAAVHAVTGVSPDHTFVHVTHAVTAGLFPNREADLDIPVGQLVFDDALHGFQHSSHTAFIVSA